MQITFPYHSWDNSPISIWALVHLPSDYATSPSTTKYPLLVFYHGAGESMFIYLLSPPPPLQRLLTLSILSASFSFSLDSANAALSDLHKISDTYGPCREIKQGKLMEFTVGGVNYKFIVVCPQFLSMTSQKWGGGRKGEI